jgi:hypothetical protein
VPGAQDLAHAAGAEDLIQPVLTEQDVPGPRIGTLHPASITRS